MSSSRLFYEIVKGSHEFKINRYSLAKGIGVGKFVTSSKFAVCGCDWVIFFYPDGIDQASKEYVSVYIKPVSSPGEVTASFGFELLDQTGKGKHDDFYKYDDKSPETFKSGSPSWGYSTFMKRSAVETYLKDDCLSIHCTVRVVQTRVKEGKRCVIPVPPSDMIQNLKGFLESGVGSDITFQVGDELFKAHKWILAARSLVFRAQLFGLVGNPDMKTIVIEEFDPFGFKAMLLFLYSDELPEEHELSDSDSVCTSIALMQHLLAVADHIDLARLKLICRSVANTLSLAERYRCQELKTVCLNFATKLENFGEIMKSDGYSHVEKWCPSLLTDLLKKYMRL
ncbi:hypothetical protein MKW92_033664 [Papaver armeniacum]|nr:hypothetical protein MKW92_033664 [Papaver armeniacum]